MMINQRVPAAVAACLVACAIVAGTAYAASAQITAAYAAPMVAATHACPDDDGYAACNASAIADHATETATTPANTNTPTTPGDVVATSRPPTDAEIRLYILTHPELIPTPAPQPTPAAPPTPATPPTPPTPPAPPQVTVTSTRQPTVEEITQAARQLNPNVQPPAGIPTPPVPTDVIPSPVFPTATVTLTPAPAGSATDRPQEGTAEPSGLGTLAGLLAIIALALVIVPRVKEYRARTRKKKLAEILAEFKPKPDQPANDDTLVSKEK